MPGTCPFSMTQPNAAGSSKNSSPIKRRTFKEGEKREEMCSFPQSRAPSPNLGMWAFDRYGQGHLPNVEKSTCCSERALVFSCHRPRLVSVVYRSSPKG